MKESVLQSVLVGLNIRCTFRSPDSYVLPLRELIAEGAIPMSTIDDRVRDILRVKFLVGLFDHPYQIDLKETDKEVNCAENQTGSLAGFKRIARSVEEPGCRPSFRCKQNFQNRRMRSECR